MNKDDLLAKVKEDGVKFVSLQFTDVTGAVKSVDIPVQRLSGALDDGVWFDGSSVEGFARIQESDMRLVLDPDTYAVLPWTPAELRRARIFCDIYQPDGTPFPGDPRGTLQAHAGEDREARLDLQRRTRAGVLPLPAQRAREHPPGAARCRRLLRFLRPTMRPCACAPS